MNVVDAGIVTVRKKMWPYFVIAALVAVLGAGTSGLYIGYQVADAKNSDERLQMASAFNAAMVEKEARRQEAEKRSQLVEGTFMTALNGLKGANKASLVAVMEETKKAIYDTCKVPDSGTDMLNDRIDSINADILGRKKK